MDIRPREIRFFEDGDVREWLETLEDRDQVAYDGIIARLERVEDGNLGDVGPCGGGVSELRFIKTGPGYRIYFGEDGDLVILLTAGSKKTQQSDIFAAQKLWRNYNA